MSGAAVWSGVTDTEEGGLDPEPSRGSSSDSLESDARGTAEPPIIVWIYQEGGRTEGG